MERIGYGYGSEWHLLHWMCRHRYRLDFPSTSAGNESE